MQISTENLARRAAEDAISKLRNEHQTTLNCLNADIMQTDTKLKIAQESLERESKKNSELLMENTQLNVERDSILLQFKSLQDSNAGIKMDLEEAKAKLLGYSEDLEKWKIEKIQLCSANEQLQSKYDHMSTTFERSNSRISGINNLIEQVSEMYDIL